MILGATFYWMEGNENKEQPIIKRDCLPDGIVALENAQWIAVAQNQRSISFEHIFFLPGTYIGFTILLLYKLPRETVSIFPSSFGLLRSNAIS